MWWFEYKYSHFQNFIFADSEQELKLSIRFCPGWEMEFLLHIDEYKLTYEGDAMFKIAMMILIIEYVLKI